MNVPKAGFWSSRKEVWHQLAAAVAGAHIDGGFGRSDRVLARHGDWTIVLDTYFCAASKITYTRLRAPFVNPDGFRFTIYRRGLFSEVARLFGMQDVTVGFADFDKAFIVKGTDEGGLRSLLADARLRELIAAAPKAHLSVRDTTEAFETDPGANADELSAIVPGVIKDAERLRALFELFAEALDQLCRIGSAYETAPAATRCPYCDHQLVSQDVCPECGQHVAAPRGHSS